MLGYWDNPRLLWHILLNRSLNGFNSLRAGTGTSPEAGPGYAGIEVQTMRLLRQQEGQMGIEYLLVAGTVVVAFVIGFQALMPEVVRNVVAIICPSVDTAAAGNSCLTFL